MTKFLPAPFLLPLIYTPHQCSLQTETMHMQQQFHATPRVRQSEARARTCMYYVYEPHACDACMAWTTVPVFSPLPDRLSRRVAHAPLLGVGNRFKPTVRFGLYGESEVRF